jgi:hypothetical protein
VRSYSRNKQDFSLVEWSCNMQQLNKLLYYRFCITFFEIFGTFLFFELIGNHQYLHSYSKCEVINYLCTMPWRRVEEWRYSCTIRNVIIRWTSVVSSTSWPPDLQRNIPCTHCTGSWVSPRASLDAVENKKILGNRAPTAQPVASHWLSYPFGTECSFQLHARRRLHERVRQFLLSL